MKNTSQKIVFFGTEQFSLTALSHLIQAGYNIVAVVTKPDSKKGRGQQLTPPEVKVLAAKHNIPVWQPTRLAEIADRVSALGVATGVLVSYGKIIPQSIIDLFSPGIINVHPSLLPAYRGPAPIESAIINGDIETGVTIMKLDAAMDAGPLYAVRTHPLAGTETGPELYRTLAVAGAELLIEVLPAIIDGSLQPHPQDDTKASYTSLLKKEDAPLDLTSLTAIQAERRVRAYLSFPKSKLKIGDNQIIITKAHVSQTKNTPLDSSCQDGAFLVIDELITPNGRRTDGAAFSRGYSG